MCYRLDPGAGPHIPNSLLVLLQPLLKLLKMESGILTIIFKIPITLKNYYNVYQQKLNPLPQSVA